MVLTTFRPRRGWVRTVRALVNDALSFSLAMLLLTIVAALARIVFVHPY